MSKRNISTFPFLPLVVCMLMQMAGASMASEGDDTRLFAFVGRNVSIDDFDPPPCELEEPDGGEEADLELECIILDAAFWAKYKILKVVHGDYSGKTVEFEMYTHWGRVSLPQTRESLMFVVMSKDRKFAAKYLYFDVYKARDGRWATCGDPFLGSEDYESQVQKIPFRRKVTYDATGLSEDNLENRFPGRFYEIRRDKAVCRGEGLYVEQLFELAKKYSWQLERFRKKD